MAFDISIDEAASQLPPAPHTFVEFYEHAGPTIARVLRLACHEEALADQALAFALARTLQRWKQLRGHPNLLGATIEAGVAHADAALKDRGPVSMNEATGGYVRGLPLDEAVEALPLRQRAALVTAHYLGWSDSTTAAGAGERIATVATRRTRAVTFLAHHLRVDDDEAVDRVTQHFTAVDSARDPNMPTLAAIRRSARRQTVRNRGLAALAVVLIIVVGAGAVQVGRQSSAPEATGPQPIDPPTSSSDWFPPVSDGRGGFIALNTAGSSLFARSDDGIEWFEAATWNSRAVDLRTEVTSLRRSGGRLFSTIEAVAAVRGALPPRLATSTDANDLRDWRVSEVDVELDELAQGLVSRSRVVAVAGAGGSVLVALGVDESIDYQALEIARQDVCVQATSDKARALYLCSGEVISIERALTPAQYLLSRSAGPFEPVDVPLGVDPRSLVSYGTGYALSDAASGELWLSDDGQAWRRDETMADADRFVLLEGRTGGELLVVQPLIGGWTSSRVDPETGGRVRSEIGLQLDPAVVWNKPELAVGPAGWALFVTTSRPWERGASIPGWAIDVGEWTVSRQPDADTLTAQRRDQGTTYRFLETSDAVEIDDDGNVRLFLPDAADPAQDQSVLQIAAEDIEESRAAASDDVKAQVFFSVDGSSWRQIWQTTQEAWFGTVAVGDEEVLISGTSLTGPPISVPLE